ncbi:DoxX family protein [Profundibacterium mesophilum]|uniref:DoxX domain containing protein n=1 Tax=Profundibacterium mesophilum KAUST100406-0324 TaxID=1037889 RepID=A0A921NPM7_9RHOB|nr:DoxX family protein [Profundibacterium mesophilum]KAF0674795.1 DoxX domain containing protein [Profundibacterium mesophilum KAUST100406-0324]
MTTSEFTDLAGRVLLGSLFLAGAVQKWVDPLQVEGLLAGWSLPAALVWPALVFNAVAGALLIAGIARRPVALTLAAYTALTSFFHLVPGDGWQMSIFVKNWAIAGGLLVVAGHAPPARGGDTVRGPERETPPR